MLAPTHLSVCQDSSATPALCRKLIQAVQALRGRLLEKYTHCFPGHPALVRRALRAAETQAWSTAYPHLLLPDLAELEVSRALGEISHPRNINPEGSLARAA